MEENKAKESEKRVLVIGVDAITFDLLDPWIKQNKLPHIAGLMDGGYAFLGTMRPREASVEGVEEPIVLAFVRGDVGVLPWPKPTAKALNKSWSAAA